MWAAVARHQTGNQSKLMLSGKVSYDQECIGTSNFAPLHFPHMIRSALALQLLHPVLFFVSCDLECAGTSILAPLHFPYMIRHGSPVVRTLAYHEPGPSLFPGLGGENY